MPIGGSIPSCRKGPSVLFRVRGEGRWAEARGRERGWGSWRGAASLLPISYGVCGSAVSSRSEVRGGAPAAKRFSCILEGPDGLSCNLLGTKFGGHGPLKKGKVFPYSLPSVGPGADPGVQAVSPQVT